MDIGFGRVLEMCEERFGAKVTTGLLALIVLTITVFCIGVFWAAVSKFVLVGLPWLAVNDGFRVFFYIAIIFYIAFQTVYLLLFHYRFEKSAQRSRERLKKIDQIHEEISVKHRKTDKILEEINKKIGN